MSIPVDLTDLATSLANYPWGYFITVGEQQVAHSLAVPTDYRDGVFHLQAGRGSRANAAARPQVSMVFPGADGTAYSLVIDGTASVADDGVQFAPSNAVLHRPALRND
jgi:hypothetical protein